MEVITTDPSTFTAYSDFANTNVVDVYLGQKVYLAIFLSSFSPGVTSLIPLNCQAKSTTSANLTLWNLSGISTNKCVLEPSVIRGSFAYYKGAVDVAFVGMEAFQFQGETTEEITFNCIVRICFSAKQGSQCEKDHEALDACESAQTTTTATTNIAATAATDLNPMGRKRRDVMETDDSPVGTGSLHHVTATLHIRDDVMTTGVCSSVLYTASCLVLAVLVAIIT